MLITLPEDGDAFPLPRRSVTTASVGTFAYTVKRGGRILYIYKSLRPPILSLAAAILLHFELTKLALTKAGERSGLRL